MSKTEAKTVSLVLGSGGARGLAHIGVINWLEEHGYEIDAVAGCSIGSLIGGVYAAGKLSVLEEWMRALTRTDMLALLDIAWKRDGILKGDKVFNKLIDLVGDVMIEELRIPFTAVAYDLVKEKEVWLQSGALFNAVRASCAIPFVLTPVTFGSMTLVDGGVINPVPMAPAFNSGADLIVAVNLGGPFNHELIQQASVPDSAVNPSAFSKRISEFIKSLALPSSLPFYQGVNPSLIYYQTFDAMQGTIARHILAVYPPDLLIQISRNACGTMEFDRAAELIEQGYAAAEKVIGGWSN